MKGKQKFWMYGQQALIARIAGIRPGYLSDILHRRRGVSGATASELERASRTILGEPIPFREWVLNRESDHPAFFGKSK